MIVQWRGKGAAEERGKDLGRVLGRGCVRTEKKENILDGTAALTFVVRGVTEWRGSCLGPGGERERCGQDKTLEGCCMGCVGERKGRKGNILDAMAVVLYIFSLDYDCMSLWAKLRRERWSGKDLASLYGNVGV